MSNTINKKGAGVPRPKKAIDKLRIIAEIDFAYWALTILSNTAPKRLHEEGVSPGTLRDASIKLIEDINRKKKLLGMDVSIGEKTLKELRSMPDAALGIGVAGAKRPVRSAAKDGTRAKPGASRATPKKNR